MRLKRKYRVIFKLHVCVYNIYSIIEIYQSVDVQSSASVPACAEAAHENEPRLAA